MAVIVQEIATRPQGALPGNEVRRELAQVLESPDFDASRRSREFLRFVVEETLAGRADELSQARIALRVFGRREDFDATVDPIVRIQAGRLRRSLERYYLLRGSTSTLRLELPRGGYVPTFRTVQGPPAAPEEAPAVPAVDDWPTVVVGRFDNATGDPAHDTTTDQIREVLATELGRYSDIRVASFGQRTSDRGGPAASWRFTLAGSLRSAGPGVEVSARLTDATSGLQLWADTYRAALERGGSDPPVDDAIRVVAARVASEEGVIVQTLAAEARRTGFAANSFGAVLRSYDFYVARDGRLFPEALDALRDAVARDPECSLAWTRLARLCVANHAFEISEIDTPIAAAITYAQSGVRLDPSSRRARCVLGTAQLVGGDLRAARREADEALRQAQGSLIYLEIIGWLVTLAGDWDRGPAIVREAVDRNPHHLPHVSNALWLHHLRRGDYAAALAEALAYQDSAFFWRALMRACTLGLLGRLPEAEREVGELLAQKPDFASRGRVLIGRYIKFEELQERIAEGLRRAGLRLD